MNRHFFGAAIAALLSAGAAGAQDKVIDLKFSTWLPPAHPTNVSAKEWGDSLAKATNNTIRTTVFPAQQLGKANDHYDMARDGIADVTYVSLGYEPGRLPIAAITQSPFLMKNATGGSRALDDWYRRYVAKDAPGVRFCLAYAHDPGTLHAKKKITKPEDIKGMKVRPAHAMMGNFVTLLGGTNVQASAPESREVLVRGVADAITFPWQSLILFKIDDAVTFHMDMPFYVATFAWFVNPAKYDAMSAAQKAAFDAHCNPQWAAKVADPWAAYEAAGRDKLRADPKHTVYPLSAEEVAAWRKAAEPLKAGWAENVRKAGSDPDAIHADLIATLKKYDAQY
ncbi:MAG: TRAP transporter substrate-binding protein [Alphaproteobacteria bacterium]|nr:TRAP transporter substrate-binding protein [Alphaproteobacteria bacterium]